MGQNLTGQTIASTYEDLVQISGSILTNGLGNDITSLTVTASFASQAGTAGYATTAGTSGFATSASFANQAGTAGYAATAGTSSFATSASFADQAGTSGYAVTAGTAGFATSASLATENLLTASVNLNTITFTKGDGTTFPITVDTGSGGGGAAFPYTGSAIITGSLVVTGSISGLLNNTQGITIYATQSADSLVGNFLIGAQDPSINGLNTGIGINNVVIGNGEFKSDLKGIASGAGNSNTIVGGWGGVIYRGSYNTIVGGGNNKMASGSALVNNIAAQYNIMAGGDGNTMNERTAYSSIIAGASNILNQAGTNGSQYSAIVAGQTNFISGSDWAGIFASRNSDITFGNYVTIVGGNNNTAAYASATSAYSAMIAGNGNTLSHSRTVVIGGQNLASTKNDEVVVPALTISGSGNLTFADGTTQSTAAGEGFPYTGSAEILGNVNVTISGSNNAYLITSGSFTGSAVDNISNITSSTPVYHVAYCTQAEYNAITPDANTLYFISGSTNNIENLTVSGSLLVSGSTTITGSLVGNVNALSISSNTASMNLNEGNFFTLQLVSGSNTYINPSNIKAGQTINLQVNTTGSATVSFPSSVKQVSGSAYVPTTTTGVDIVTFISFDTSSLFLSNVKNLV
jgi:hypothetical protein